MACVQVKSLAGLSRFPVLGSLVLAHNELDWEEVRRLSHLRLLSLSLLGNSRLDSDPHCEFHVCILTAAWTSTLFDSVSPRNIFPISLFPFSLFLLFLPLPLPFPLTPLFSPLLSSLSSSLLSSLSSPLLSSPLLSSLLFPLISICAHKLFC